MVRSMRKSFFCILLLSALATLVFLLNHKNIIHFPSFSTNNNKCFRTHMASSKLINMTLTHLNSEQLQHDADGYCTNQTCPTPTFLGNISVNTNVSANLSKDELPFVNNGGWWLPRYCKQEKSVAILVPYRDRPKHLQILLRHLHPILRRQQLHYRIFIIQQDKDYGFNRGKLFNIGVLEALKIYPFTCIVKHDVDLLPEDDRVDYGCSRSPALLSILIDKFKYKSIRERHFGGVTSLTTEHYFKVNGFTNRIYFWGGEDDDLYNRIFLERLRLLGYNGLKKQGLNPDLNRYTMLKHVSRGRTGKDTQKVIKILETTRKYYKTDGVNSAVYKVNKIVVDPLYTLIDVNLMKEKSKE